VRARRLARSALTRRSSSLVDVARQVCGIHAQVQASAELQLAARVDGIRQQDVRDALWRDRTLVKAWTLRGTLHLHPADELALWFAARRAVAGEPQALPAWPDPQGVVHPPVSVDECAELQAATWEALGGEPLLREQVADEVVRRAGKKHEGRLRSGFAFFLTETCQGPPQGNKITLVRPDRWIAGWRDVDEQVALGEVLRRFLYAYGPSRPQEFRGWFGADVSFDLVEVEQVADEVVRRAGKRHEGRLRSGFAFFLTETCQGPPQGNKITLVRPDRWIAGWRDVDEQDALGEVLRRFLYAYGPSRPQEFRGWFGADMSFDLVEVEEVDVEGRSAFVLAGDTDFPEPDKSVRLLPEYDVYVMGFREREQLVPERVRTQVAAHGRGRYEGPAGVRFLMVDGLAAGLWERKKRAKELEVAVSPATRFNRKALTAEVARFATFLGVEPALTVG